MTKNFNDYLKNDNKFLNNMYLFFEIGKKNTEIIYLKSLQECIKFVK